MKEVMKESMKKAMKKCLVIAILFLNSSNAFAQWTLVKSAGVGRMEMDVVDFQIFAGGQHKTVNTLTFSTLNLSLTGVQKKVFISINTEIPFSDQTYVVNEQDSNAIRTFERENLSLTAGYEIYRGLNVFGGYSYEANHYFNDSISNTGAVTNVTEKDSGLFLGMIYSQNFSNYGSVSATVSYALLDGEISGNDSSNMFTNNSGDTTGFNFSLTYTNRYSADLNYFLSTAVKNYEYDNVSSGAGNLNFVKEKYYFSVSAGLNIF